MNLVGSEDTDIMAGDDHGFSASNVSISQHIHHDYLSIVFLVQ
jgi:hypothetical protein